MLICNFDAIAVAGNWQTISFSLCLKEEIRTAKAMLKLTILRHKEKALLKSYV